jgi:2-polyprenyl-6-methoxyphenol hydroxylase-like FAD-dependent oxidoreductase
MRALVVGGGIGGLAAALALRRVGLDVVVLEQAPKLEVLGAGLALAANAVQALERLGVADSVRARGERTERLQAHKPDGATIVDLPLADREMLGIHRADLQDVLADELGDALTLGVACTGFTDDGYRVVVEGSDGESRAADVLVGADGLRSKTRAWLLGDRPPRYAGYTGWRAVAGFEHPSLRARMTETWGRGVRFGLIPIGGGRLYWFVSETRAEPDAPLVPGRKQEIARLVAGWHEPIGAVIDATLEDAISGTGIYARQPTRTWGRGRVTLLGDAVHPMTPDLSQGAAQALEDAVVLAASLRDAGGAVTGLRTYEAARRKRAAQIVRRSYAAGRLAQASSALGTRARDLLMGSLPDRLHGIQQRQIVDVELPRLP